MRHAALPDNNYWLQIIRKRRIFRRSFWSWFDVIRSNFDEDNVRKTIFYVIVASDVDLWPLDLKFCPLVTVVQSRDTTKLKVSIRLFCFVKMVVKGRTDRRTDGRGAQLNTSPGGGLHSLSRSNRPIDEMYVRYVTDRQTDKILQNEAISLVKCIRNRCRMGYCSFRSWLDVNRCALDKDVREKKRF